MLARDVLVFEFRYFSKGCILIHLSLAVWRVLVEAQVQTLQKDVKGQIVTDVVFAGTWLAVLLLTQQRTKTE